MSQNIKALRRRARTVESIEKITSTMEMISASKLRGAQRATATAFPYVTAIQNLVGRLISKEGEVLPPLFEKRPVKKTTIMIVSSDRGLCGGYNVMVLRKAMDYVRRNGEREEIEFFPIGRRAYRFVTKNDYPVVDAIVDHGGAYKEEMMKKITDLLTMRFLTKQTDKALMIFNGFVSAGAFEPVMETFLPLEISEFREQESGGAKTATMETVEYIVEPEKRVILQKLLPQYIQVKVLSALLEAVTTEHTARRIAMRGATDNCEDLTRTLALQINKARQTAITTEMIEISGGAEALKG